MEQTRGLFICLACVLLGFGVIMVHSASITSWPTEFEQIYLSRHVLFLAVGITAAAICAILPARFWFDAAPLLFLLTLLLLIAVLVPGIGTRVKGAQRWLRFGPASFQPSELAKITLPLMVCRQLMIARASDCGWFVRHLAVGWPILLTIPLVLIEPDLGTSLFLVAGCLIALFCSGWSLWSFAIGGIVMLPAAVTLVALRPYQMQRITGFLAAWSDFNEAPYQLRQSLMSMGAGGIWGVGLGKGWQKLSFLPEANTDFVFAVVGEELGLLGTLSLVALWTALYFCGLRLLRPFPRRGFVVTLGVTLLSQLVLQAALNVAVVTAMVPPKGISHPLVSYGGSNLLVSLLALGIVVSLSRSETEVDPIYSAA